MSRSTAASHRTRPSARLTKEELLGTPTRVHNTGSLKVLNSPATSSSRSSTTNSSVSQGGSATKRKRNQQTTAAEDLENTRRITDYFQPLSSSSSAQGQVHNLHQQSSNTFQSTPMSGSELLPPNELQRQLNMEPGPNENIFPNNPSKLSGVVVASSQRGTSSQYEQELERLHERLRDAEETIKTLHREQDHARTDRESKQRHTELLQQRLIESLKIACEKARNDFQDSLFHRRRTIGRIVLAERDGFDRTKEELWHDGEEFDRVRKEFETMEHEIKSLEIAIDDIKKRLQAAPPADATMGADNLKPFLPNVNSTYYPSYSSATTSPSSGSMSQQSSRQSSNSLAEPALPPLSSSIPEILSYYEVSTTTIPLHQLYHLLKFRLQKCRSERDKLRLELEGLEVQKKRLIRDERLLVDSLASQFQHCPLVDGRYQLLQMLGKGGFSEVYRAFDLKELRYVACKIQVIRSEWVKETKEAYIKYVQRECLIHTSLVHPHIVRFYRVVGLSPHILMFVLEECNGGDLDTYLKIKGKLSETEAGTIMMQIFHALVALKSTDDSKSKEVIHYDLKPGNILFHHGVVKISDFGLSKAKDKGTASIDQTSIGAGTAGYLPPECFASGGQLTEKVDVWSCGIIMYQMLFGELPFPPHAFSETELRQKIEKHRSVKISPECQEFVLGCLTVEPTRRLSADAALRLPFFTKVYGDIDVIPPVSTLS